MLKYYYKKIIYFHNILSLTFFIFKRNILLLFKIKVIPYKLLFKLNNSCNLSCKKCNIWQNKKIDNIDIKHINNIVNSYWKYIRLVSLSWWELMLIKNLDEIINKIINWCDNLNMISINTNWFLSKKTEITIKNILEKYSKINIIVYISIDWDEKTHNKLRGNILSYKKAMETYNRLRKIQKQYPLLTIEKAFLLSEDNKHLLKKVLKDKNTSIEIVNKWTFYNNENIINKKLDLEKLINFKDIKWFMKKIYLSWHINSQYKQKYKCYAMSSSLFINYNWDVSPCINWDKKIWSLSEDNLYNIVNTKKYRNIRKTIEQKKCPGCWVKCDAYISIIHKLLMWK